MGLTWLICRGWPTPGAALGHESATAGAAVRRRTWTRSERHPTRFHHTAGHHDNLNATGVYRATGLNFGLSTDDPAAYFANVTMPQVDAPSGHCPRDPSSALQPYFLTLFLTLTMPQVDALVGDRLGFGAADLARARHGAYAARFAPDAARLSANGTRARGGGGGGGFDEGGGGGGGARLANLQRLLPHVDMLFAAASLLLLALWWAARRCARKLGRGGGARRGRVMRARAWVEAM